MVGLHGLRDGVSQRVKEAQAGNSEVVYPAKQRGGGDMAYISDNPMFRSLSDAEVTQFEEHARNSVPGRADWTVLHPVCRRIWWEMACQHDEIDPSSNFIAFSHDNPYFQEGE